MGNIYVFTFWCDIQTNVVLDSDKYFYLSVLIHEVLILGKPVFQRPGNCCQVVEELPTAQHNYYYLLIIDPLT